jgi:hypothetical protein
MRTGKPWLLVYDNVNGKLFHLPVPLGGPGRDQNLRIVGRRQAAEGRLIIDLLLGAGLGELSP